MKLWMIILTMVDNHTSSSKIDTVKLSEYHKMVPIWEFGGIDRLAYQNFILE